MKTRVSESTESTFWIKECDTEPLLRILRNCLEHQFYIFARPMDPSLVGW